MRSVTFGYSKQLSVHVLQEALRIVGKAPEALRDGSITREGGYYEEPADYRPDAIYYRRYAGLYFVNCAQDLRLGIRCPN